METNTTVAEKIRSALGDRSKRSVALAAGISQSTFDRKLTKDDDSFTIWELGSIAEALGLTLADLLPDDMLGAA